MKIKRKELDPKGGMWYRELKALNPPSNKEEAAANERSARAFLGRRKYLERLPYLVMKGGVKLINNWYE